MDPSTVAGLLGQTLSPDAAVRKPAETQLQALEGQPGFALLLLNLLSSDGVDPTVKVASAIQFKNFVKRNWKQVRPWSIVINDVVFEIHVVHPF